MSQTEAVMLDQKQRITDEREHLDQEINRVYVIRSIAFPKTQWLLNRYREAYERFLCPICDYPIRVGPRRFLFWTRRTVNKVLVASERGEQEEIYTCPSCGTRLYEECTACHKIRPALLPHCSHCGSEKNLA